MLNLLVLTTRSIFLIAYSTFKQQSVTFVVCCLYRVKGSISVLILALYLLGLASIAISAVSQHQYTLLYSNLSIIFLITFGQLAGGVSLLYLFFLFTPLVLPVSDSNDLAVTSS